MSTLSIAGAAAIASAAREHVAVDDTVSRGRAISMRPARDAYQAPKPKSSSLQRMLNNKSRI